MLRVETCPWHRAFNDSVGIFSVFTQRKKICRSNFFYEIAQIVVQKDEKMVGGKLEIKNYSL